MAAELRPPAPAALIWPVGALCRAVTDALQARFDPVVVRGEISGFTRAASGHCYFSLKDADGQLRCAMFKRSASQLDFSPKDGEQVQASGKLSVYEPRGDLQLIVESLSAVGQGAWFERFLRLKARLEQEGLFDASRKRPLTPMPGAIGLVTSLGAAALHDVLSALARRAPHVPVVLAPAAVQGAEAPAELIRSLQSLYLLALMEQGLQADFSDDTVAGAEAAPMRLDVILLVRGGGSLEDLWAFNDEALARTIAQSPVPVVCGVGHETDFTLADFVADVRAPTPTAAAELAAQTREFWIAWLDRLQRRLQDLAGLQIDRKSQRLDAASARLGRPGGWLAVQRMGLSAQQRSMQGCAERRVRESRRALDRLADQLALALGKGLAVTRQRLERVAYGLDSVDPRRVLQRGYAWLSDAQGRAVTRCGQVHSGQSLKAILMDGTVDLTVRASAP